MALLVMKRLVPFLILAAFFLGITGGKVSRLHVKLQIRASTPGCPQFSIYLPGCEPSKKLDVAEQPLTQPCNLISFLEPSQKSLPPWPSLSPASPKHYCWLGLGCGGLPS
jgi:hypothetical protein